MRSATVRARIEPDLKNQAEHIFKALGILPAEAIRLFYHQSVLSRGIPFKLQIPNEKTLAAVAELDSKKKHKRFHSVKKVLESLEND
ncbi:MAG TPA: type II toxin-antitoxin system antitoxin, RelB/DinJ family [Lentisphaeria bacterium]|nr:type II toxin-antitoxin system antitoxin, RelB/DinJ family [Lentisphaeria bacterium]